jgi:hypothetical protein
MGRTNGEEITKNKKEDRDKKIKVLKQKLNLVKSRLRNIIIFNSK